MASSNGNIFRLIGPLWGEPTGHWWIPITKASEVELLCFLWSAPEQTTEQTMETPVIWDAIAALVMTSLLLIRVCDICNKLYTFILRFGLYIVTTVNKMSNVIYNRLLFLLLVHHLRKWIAPRVPGTTIHIHYLYTHYDKQSRTDSEIPTCISGYRYFGNAVS